MKENGKQGKTPRNKIRAASVWGFGGFQPPFCVAFSSHSLAMSTAVEECDAELHCKATINTSEDDLALLKCPGRNGTCALFLHTICVRSGLKLCLACQVTHVAWSDIMDQSDLRNDYAMYNT